MREICKDGDLKGEDNYGKRTDKNTLQYYYFYVPEAQFMVV
jgi:hypothetical protein